MNEIWVSVLSGGLGVAIVGGIFKLLEKRVDRKNEKEDKAEEKADENRTREIAELKEAINALASKVEAMDGKLDSVTEGTMANLGNSLKSMGCGYLQTGSISATDLEDWLRMHEIYHNKLHGNGYLDSIKERLTKLPIKER